MNIFSKIDSQRDRRLPVLIARGTAFISSFSAHRLAYRAIIALALMLFFSGGTQAQSVPTGDQVILQATSPDAGAPASTSGTTVAYTYNALNQLTSYRETDNPSGQTRSVTLEYDPCGNRIKRTVMGGIDAGIDTYQYDLENRLVEVNKGTGTSGTGIYKYAYDYRNRRILRDESGAGGRKTRISYSGGTSVAEYDDENTTPSVEYIRGSDMGGGVGGILYTIHNTGQNDVNANSYNSNVSYTHANHRGDIVAKTAANGQLTYQAQYEAFGTRNQEIGTTSDRQKANSKDEDPTGLLNEGFRYRDLEAGVFLTADPAGFVDGPNLYTYVKQNPWTAFDPEGLSWWSNAWKGDFDKAETTWGGVAAQTAIGFIPVVGQVADVRDTVASAKNVYENPKSGEAWAGLGMTAVGWVPGAGDALKSAAKARKAAKGATHLEGSAKSTVKKAEHAAEEVKVKPKGDPVKPGDTGTYGELKERKAVNGETEALHMDHQPSFAAQVKAKEAELGRELSPSERAQLKNSTPAVASPKKIHQETSPTYGGRNTPEQIKKDADNLKAAEVRDKAAFNKAIEERAKEEKR